MTERLQLYKCEVCGNVVQVILEGEGELVCCGQPMNHMTPKKNDENANEKHVPVFVKTENGEEIRVGSTPHPMENEHYIMFIECISEDKNSMKLHYLYPQQEPKMLIKEAADKYKALEYCNIHGLWEGNNDK
ncbi:desulfoferrodoxin FeS4 iron-binding domain-containing protein [Spirochaetes bacterium]|uniref:Desulfoferrodoxin n=1 Tax=Candidatus Scatousia excrementipullorum TaxID=2840936 RepID=A0A9D9DPV6_9BACT|nr:desulfoferrodoxin FeS4 iron-binding domain-containing protein [Candidatus Scatousia excrementipullorum]